MALPKQTPNYICRLSLLAAKQIDKIQILIKVQIDTYKSVNLISILQS